MRRHLRERAPGSQDRLAWLVAAGLFLGYSCPAVAQAPEDSAAVTGALADSAADTARGPELPHFEPIPDRWRQVTPPPYELYVEGHWYDPYNQNTLKGDFPLLGQNTFFLLTATSESNAEFVRVPTPSGLSTQEPQSPEFFGKSDRFLLNQTFRLALELYHGDAAYKPRDWELRITPAFNLNVVSLDENNNVNINVRKGTSRTDSHLGFQELFLEKHLVNLSSHYDFLSLRVGIQKFGSDFRGFLFKDENLGVRFFGNAGSNRWQYNLAYFHLLEKDTNSELNTVFEDRHQQVVVANLYKQDLFTLGYTGQWSFHMNRDEGDPHVDENGVPVRPAVLGTVRPHEIRAYYLGWTGDGHFGSLNISHALYQVLGTDDFNPVAGREVDLNAQFAALELSIDKDWRRYRLSAAYASGDDDAADGTAKGFDSILDEPYFAGSPESYWTTQPIRLLAVNLVSKRSFLPTLRSSKTEGQANFINPGIFLANLGYDAELTPKLKLGLNASYLSFVQTEALESLLNQDSIDAPIGLDYGLGLFYRPFLNNNALISLSVSALTPFAGFNDVYESPGTQIAASTFVNLTF